MSGFEDDDWTVDTCEEFQAEPNVADCVEIKFRAPHAIDAASSPNLTHCVISTQVRTLRV